MMEDAIAGGPGLSPEEQAAAAEEAAEAKTAANDAAQAAAEGEAPDDAGSDDAGSDERNPAADQAPVATEAQETIVGDQGARDEQQPQVSEGRPAGVDTPHRTSAPPPEAQSGVPLPEDRAAGVQPGGEGQE